MDYLSQKLPKDLINIVEEYAKDRTNYDKVIEQFSRVISDAKLKTCSKNFHWETFTLHLFIYVLLTKYEKKNCGPKW
jgi:hypothetical protein